MLNGHTPDISKFKLFSFYDNIKYLDSEIKLPESRALTGKFLGFEPTKGDHLVYRILPDSWYKGDATHYLVRSIVEPDSKPNYQTGLMRSLPLQQEPFDDPIKPPRRSARLNPSLDNEPFVSLRRQKVKPEEPLWLSIEQDYMNYLEINNPWALEDDPWAINEITGHRGANKEI